MKRKRRRDRKAGFTLVELMVVAVIVAILAAVAIPLMSANKNRALMTEAEAALGTIRSALRAQYAETGKYNEDINGNAIVANSSVTAIPGISAGDLDGRWWSEECYTFTDITESTYTIRAEGDDSTSQEKDDIAGLWVELDQDGSFQRGPL